MRTPHLVRHAAPMQTESINRLFRAGKLKRDMFGAQAFRAGKSLGVTRALNAEMIEGRRDGAGRSPGGGARTGYGKKLHSLIGPARKAARRTSSQGANGFDPRQRAIVKIHYFSHAGGGAAALRAHARYVARDAAAREVKPGELLEVEAQADQADAKARAHAKYLERDGAGGVFYDALSDASDGSARAAKWAGSDRRHFRLIVAPENGTKLGDLRDYTREVMRRAEMALGSRLEWVAADHWDTDNPHTHLILRGVRDDGRDLIIPREFVQHGFRSVARDVATERLGSRSRKDDRLALHREVRAHRPTRLDNWIADQLDKDGKVRIADLQTPYGAPSATDALKGRAHELRRLGLATEVRRNVLQFAPNWRDGLKALELHLDIRKALMQSRAIEAARTHQAGKSISTLLRSPER